MASKRTKPPTRAELRFWELAFLNAPDGNGRHAPEYVAHKHADYANAAVAERRIVLKGVSR